MMGGQPWLDNDSRSRSIDLCREALGMEPLDRKIRQCLKCDNEFQSNGKQNRMCYRCAHSGKEPIKEG